jgi:transcriptional regulator with PAS, ATPase and Fis domain
MFHKNMNTEATTRSNYEYIIKQYCNTDEPLMSILQRVPQPYPRPVRALLYLEESLERKRLAKDAIEAVEAVTIEEAGADVFILILSDWAELMCTIMQPRDAEALVHRAKSVVSDSTLPEIFVRLMRTEALIADTTGNKTKALSILEEILRILQQESPRRKFYIWEYALFLARHGKLADAKHLIPELIKQCNQNFPLAVVTLVQFINAVETGLLQEAIRLSAEIQPNINLLKTPIRIMYLHYYSLLKLMRETMQNIRISTHEASKPLNEELPSLTILRCLISREPEAALRLARIEANKMLDSIFSSGFDSYNFVRAELSCGHWEAARRIISMRQTRGNTHYLDDLFMARIYLLSNNTEQSARCFANVLKSAKKYEALGRLDFELLLSCELSPMRLVELARMAEQISRLPEKSLEKEERSIVEVLSHPTPASLDLIIGQSPAITAIKNMIRKLADVDAPVLITGETGTGKELVARCLHETSSRRTHPFIAVNCGAIPETLLESELFGHMRGAFTGADKTHVGLFEEAGEGTIFLDEIGEVPLRLQLSLLRVLETREIRPVGSSTIKKVKCRVIAATNADITKLAEQGKFRKDLLYRLQRLTIHIPPLRERREDIMLLVRYFIDLGRKIGTHAVLSPELCEVLRSYDWPGNVRELKNVVERMRLMHSDKLSYSLADLDLKFKPSTLKTDIETPAISPESTEEILTPSEEEDFTFDSTSRIRRIEKIKELFLKHKKLTRNEIVDALDISPNTATKDLKALIDEGFIIRVEPSASTRSHYFQLREENTT